ncbi:colicin E1 family microcin immunity protein [Mixta intestinalis]|uniref:Colicin transporter n=1 Tax=Mixta intestinalis TaxID=1615494 RepID=A0A6P1Q6P7_9GAMM|nr:MULTISPECIES: colicin E1 family microcin immunity protein [Mixta]QHM74072.1 hypothetical protein C7M51_04433 [Mixta intestinalis]QHM75170.1 hypothetical protein C7M52_01119 [Mixta theicola]
MTKSVYWKSQLWGIPCFLLSLYYVFRFHERFNLSTELCVIIAVLSLILYPFSKSGLEKLALQFTSREFWHRGLFVDTVGKNPICVLYYMLCFVIALPVGLIYLIIGLRRKRKAV